MLDGAVARLTKSVSEFGKELDSICDMVSFGVAPAVLVFMAYLPEGSHLPMMSAKAESIVGKTGSYMAIVYVICTALRLARFNTYQAHKRDTFVGLPSPAAGGSLASCVLFLSYFEPRLETAELGPVAYYTLAPLSLVLAGLMVSAVVYPKDNLKSFVLAPHNAFWVLGISAFFIAAIHYAITKSPGLVLFPLSMLYVTYGIGTTAYMKVTGKPWAVPEEEEDNEAATAEVLPHKSDMK